MLVREAEEENVMVVNLDIEHIDIDIIEKGKLVFTRGIASSFNDPKKIDKIVSQINISINTYQKESSKSVDQIILAGPNHETAGYMGIIASELELPVQTIDQTKDILIDDSAKEAAKEVSFAELLGISLMTEDIKINLMPEEAEEEVRLVSLKNNLITVVFLFAVFVTVLLCIFIKNLHDKSTYISAINKELKTEEPQIGTAKKALKDINIIREVMAKKPLAVDIVSEIYDITPSGVSLSTIDFESQKSLVLRGNAQAIGDVVKYVTILENSPYFESVKPKYANKRNAENKEITDFEIEAVPSKLK